VCETTGVDTVPYVLVQHLLQLSHDYGSRLVAPVS
jgi:hypothetical protein